GVLCRRPGVSSTRRGDDVATSNGQGPEGLARLRPERRFRTGYAPRQGIDLHEQDAASYGRGAGGVGRSPVRSCRLRLLLQLLVEPLAAAGGDGQPLPVAVLEQAAQVENLADVIRRVGERALNG